MLKQNQYSKILFRGNHSRLFVQSLVKQHINWDQCITLDLSKISFITPIICVFAKIAKLRGWEIIQPDQKDPALYLRWMTGESHQRPDRYMSAQIINGPNLVHQMTQKFLPIFRNWVKGEAASDLQYAFSELIDNVFDHAEAPCGPCICAQKYPGNIEATIADLGIGIANSFKGHEVWTSKTPRERFIYALEMQKTSKPEVHSGEGLSSVLIWLKDNRDCEAFILSHEHMWWLFNNKDGTYAYPNIVWPGTLIWFFVPLQPQKNLCSIWQEVGLGTDDINGVF